MQHIDHYEHSTAFNDLEKQVLHFAEQWTRKSKADAEVVTALLQKLTPTQVVVLAATVAEANWTNRFNETFDVQLP
jgi:alkylhydroperoxidase family enzyme